MSKYSKNFLIAIVTMALWACCSFSAFGATAREINRDVDKALRTLYSKSPAAVKLSRVARGILVFPKVYKAAFIVGAKYGEGAFIQDNRITGYYSTAGASYGLQAGAQAFGYAMFFMTEKSLDYLNKSEGFEIGVGPSVVVVDQGMAKSLTSTTLSQDVYVFFFNQQGLMAGLGIKGTKITRINPSQ